MAQLPHPTRKTGPWPAEFPGRAADQPKATRPRAGLFGRLVETTAISHHKSYSGGLTAYASVALLLSGNLHVHTCVSINVHVTYRMHVSTSVWVPAISHACMCVFM